MAAIPVEALSLTMPQGKSSDNQKRPTSRPAPIHTAVLVGACAALLLAANLAATTALLLGAAGNFSTTSPGLQPPDEPLAPSPCPPPADARELAAAVRSQHEPLPSVEALQYYEPKSVEDPVWKESKYFVFRNETVSGRYLIEGLEIYHEEGFVLVHTALKDRSFAWFADTQTWADVTGMDIHSEDFKARKLLWWAAAARWVGGVVASWGMEQVLDSWYG